MGISGLLRVCDVLSLLLVLLVVQLPLKYLNTSPLQARGEF